MKNKDSGADGASNGKSAPEKTALFVPQTPTPNATQVLTDAVKDAVNQAPLSSGTMVFPAAAPKAGPVIAPLRTTPFAATPMAATPIEATPIESTPDTPNPGDRINQYEVIRPLGSGGMGTVVLARDTRLGRRVAIKFLHTRDSEFTDRFILEARATARCAHENIVIIFEVGEFEGGPFMVLEYLEGQPLSKIVRQGERLPPARAVDLMVPVVRALAAAHEQNIVHRDLKPDNIFLTDSGSIKVLDFGIAKVLRGEKVPEAETPRSFASAVVGSPGLTQVGTVMGTLAFMSPEQWSADEAIDHRTDIWAVGVMLFWMLAGRHPLEPLEGLQLQVIGKLDEPMPKLRDLAPDAPVILSDIVDRCLVKRKEDRIPDAHALLRALEAFQTGRFAKELRVDESPYTGLVSFQEADADRFFGRTQEVAALTQRLRDRALVAVVGPSGSGKSSFVRAGLVPALKRSGEAWESLVLRPGRSPLAALASLVAPMVTSSPTLEGDLDEQRKLADKIRAEPGYVGSVLRARARRENRRILLFVDQFEELYTLIDDAQERLAFTTCLSALADDATSPIRVVLSLRSDFLDRAAEDPRFLSELSQGLFFLTVPTQQGLRDALVQPAEMAGYRFESPEIVENMLMHLAATPGVLPLLQFAASKLWDNRDSARKLLTLSSYKAIGGITGALATHADSVLEELPPKTRAIARSVLLRLVTSERTRAIVSIDELRELSQNGAEVQNLVDQLVQARLLVVQSAGAAGSATVEIVHESLLHTWPTLRRWLDESQEDAGFLEQLRAAARQWQLKNRDAGLLWRGEVAAEAQRFQKRYRGELPELQRDFLKAVFAQLARSAKRRRMLVVGSTTFLGFLVVASAVALVIIRNAQREAERQAVVARLAEDQARKNLVEVQAKEKERQRAAGQAAEAKAQVELTNGQLLKKNDELQVALKKADEERANAASAQYRAEQNATTARHAQAEALQSAKDLAELLRREKDRAQRLQTQLGSPVIEELK